MSWPRVKLGDVATINPRSPRDVDENQQVTFVAMASASEDGHLLASEARILSETKKGFTYFDKNDVLLAKITPCFENGKCLRPGQIPTEIGFGSTEFHVIRPDVEKLDGLYLFYLVWNEQFRFFGEKSMSGAAGQKRVGSDFLKGFEIPLPPLPEQKRIAAILDKADAIRRKRQQAIQFADDFLRAVFLEMFGDPVTNSKGWEVRSIDELCTQIVDCVNRTAPIVNYTTPYKMIRTTNVRNCALDISNVRYVDEETYKKWTRRLEPKVGDIIFTREAPAGEAAVVHTNEKIFLGQRTMHFRPDREKISSEYLMFELMGGGVKRQIYRMHAGSTVAHLSVPECNKFQIRVPPLGLQKKFDAIIKTVSRLSALSTLATEIPLLESISQKSFSGVFKKELS